MKIYEIALFLLVFQVSIGLVNSSGAFASQLDQSSDIGFITTAKDSLEQSNLTQSEVSQGNDFLTAVGNFLYSSTLFVTTLGSSMLLVGNNIGIMLGGSDAAYDIGRNISYIVYFIYLVAAIQFIGNRSFKSFE